MSMLSAQRDELRWLADNLEEHDSHMDEYVQAMRSAADTIWELRNDCVELRDENAKLSNQLTDVTESMGRVEERCANLRAERDEWHRVAVSKQDIIDHMRDARAENAKLWELAKAAWGCVKRHVSCDECRMVCSGCTLQSAMHELRIEVDE